MLLAFLLAVVFIQLHHLPCYFKLPGLHCLHRHWICSYPHSLKQSIVLRLLSRLLVALCVFLRCLDSIPAHASHSHSHGPVDTIATPLLPLPLTVDTSLELDTDLLIHHESTTATAVSRSFDPFLQRQWGSHSSLELTHESTTATAVSRPTRPTRSQAPAPLLQECASSASSSLEHSRLRGFDTQLAFAPLFYSVRSVRSHLLRSRAKHRC